jgi:hypothetical protein
VVGRAVRISPDAVRDAEQLLAPPAPSGRGNRPGHGIPREIIELLDGDE